MKFVGITMSQRDLNRLIALGGDPGDHVKAALQAYLDQHEQSGDPLDGLTGEARRIAAGVQRWREKESHCARLAVA